MSKYGRKNKYYSHVQPYLNEIPELLQTMTEEQIAKKLGVGYSSWAKYKLQFAELRDTIKKGNTSLVEELKSILKKKARGYHYEEKKVIIDHGEVVREEIYTKYAQPDVASLNLLLKNLDKDNWANDPQIIELRKKELELKERQAW